MDYLTLPSVAQTIPQNGRMIVNVNWEGCGRKWSWPN